MVCSFPSTLTDIIFRHTTSITGRDTAIGNASFYSADATPGRSLSLSPSLSAVEDRGDGIDIRGEQKEWTNM